MKTKTSELIEKMLKEELNQQIPVQGNPTQQQSQTLPQQPQQSTASNPDEQQEEVEQKVEVYIPLHDGKFTNRIFSTNKNILLKVLDDSLETDIDTLMELENNPSTYNQISI